MRWSRIQQSPGDQNLTFENHLDSDTIMIFHQHIPSFPLNQFIESFVYYRGFEPDHRLDRLLPDGNVTLVIDLKEEPQHIYDNETLQEIQACRYAWLSGIRNMPITIPSGKDSEMFIVQFHKGKSLPFVKTPLHIFTDHVVDGSIPFRGLIHDLRNTLQDQLTIEEKFHSAERYLLECAGRNLEVNPFIDYAVSHILQSPGQQTIAAICDKVGYSQKHMIHLFKTHVGMTPKSFMRVIRFQKVIGDIEQSTQVDWSSIAYQCGYFDHAHFIHDFRHFSGITPQQYLSVKNDQLNYLPVA